MTSHRQSAAWIRSGSLLAFPQDWQTPAKTEQWVYDACRKRLPSGRYFELVCFPWATLIDLLRRDQMAKAEPLLAMLQQAPPRKTLIRATVCQHIYAKDMLSWFEHLRITDLFWPHATPSEPMIAGIRVHPFPLYPVRCLDGSADSGLSNRPAAQRRYLYSFIGAYQPGLYSSAVRQWLFDLPPRDDAYVERRHEWHYERQVYGEQIGGERLSEDERRQERQNASHYASILGNSVFSLCPSGSGPNSIRLWESLGLGCIPVILADALRLPGDQREWDEAVVRIPESKPAVDQLPLRLERLAHDGPRIEQMRRASETLWSKYGLNGPLTVLGEMSQPAKVSAWSAPSRSAPADRP